MENLNLKKQGNHDRSREIGTSNDYPEMEYTQASGSARIPDVKFNYLTNSGIRYSLACNENYSGGLSCEYARCAKLKKTMISFKCNAKEEKKNIDPQDVKSVITLEEKNPITEIMIKNSTIEEFITETILKSGKNIQSSQMKEKKEKSNCKKSEEQKTEIKALQTKPFIMQSKVELLFVLNFAKYVAKEIRKLMHIMMITISRLMSDGYVNHAIKPYMARNAG